MEDRNDSNAQKMSDFAFWTDEWSRIYLQLTLEQKNQGNWKGNNLSSIGKQKVREQFNRRTGNSWGWSKFKNRFDWFRKQFEMYKELTSTDNADELVFEPDSGSLALDNSWWEKKLKEFPKAATKLRKNSLRDILLLEQVFHGTTVANHKGWNPPTSTQPKGSKAESEPEPSEEGSGDSNNLSSAHQRNSSSGKRTKPVDQSTSGARQAKKPAKNNNDGINHSLERIAEVFESLRSARSKLSIESSIGKDPYGIASCMEFLCNLKDVKHGCRLWWAAVDLFEQRPEKRETFVSIPSQELRVQWLERTLGFRRHDQG